MARKIFIASDLVMAGFDKNSANYAYDLFVNNKLTEEENKVFVKLLSCKYIPGQRNSKKDIDIYNGILYLNEEVLIKLLTKIKEGKI